MASPIRRYSQACEGAAEFAQGNTVDALKKACPGYAVMRSLVMSFRTILRTGKVKTLRAWMKKADASGIYRMQRFVRTLKQDQGAVEAAVEQSWSNSPVEGQINQSTEDTEAPDVWPSRI